MPKNAKEYICEDCDFICSKKSNFTKHLTTRKHKNSYNELQEKMPNKYYCKCGKNYNFRQGLYTHSKKCSIINNDNVNINVNDNENDNENDNNTDYKFNLLIKETTDFKNIILDMIKQNNERQNQMIEPCKNSNISTNIINSNNIITTNHNNNNTMTNSNNKTFNLQVFLNEQCKDAMNLSDFMESIQLSLEDLENMDKLGYVECMFKNIFGDMEFISIFDRQFHCSDFKRGIIYIKENGVWEKEEMGYTRLINAIRIVEKKNFKLLKEWSEKHPSFSDYNSPDNDKYVKLFGETMNGDKHNLAKLIRKLSKECVIDKSKL